MVASGFAQESRTEEAKSAGWLMLVKTIHVRFLFLAEQHCQVQKLKQSFLDEVPQFFIGSISQSLFQVQLYAHSDASHLMLKTRSLFREGLGFV